MNRRRFCLTTGTLTTGALLAGSGIALVAGGASPTQAAEVIERVIGDENAPVTIIEYASLTCPHCAAFHNDSWPQIKADYVDTGKVKFVMRDFPLDRAALAASVLAHCAGPDRYFRFLDFFFANQASWSQAADPIAALRQQSKLGGLGDAQMDACLNDQAMADAVLTMSHQGQQEHNVRSTPTFVVNGQVLAGSLSAEALAEIIDQHLN